VVVLAFVVVTQLPPGAYNFRDDYQKYFGHTVRMLETGTVFGSPLSVIGLDTLGGQAFLQAFPVAFFSLRYINGVDAAFAMFLCMMLASQFTKGRQELLPMALVCTLSVVIIDPQYVNVSALYTGSLLMMALIEEEGSDAAVTGLLYGALAAMKTSFALFILAHLAATLWVRGVKWTGRTVAAGALFLAPWILVHAPHYVAVLGGGQAIADNGVRPVESFNIFSTEALSYGSTAANYPWLVNRHRIERPDGCAGARQGRDDCGGMLRHDRGLSCRIVRLGPESRLIRASDPLLYSVRDSSRPGGIWIGGGGLFGNGDTEIPLAAVGCPPLRGSRAGASVRAVLAKSGRASGNLWIGAGIYMACAESGISPIQPAGVERRHPTKGRRGASEGSRRRRSDGVNERAILPRLCSRSN
jgi:hypothetical protein